MFTTFFLIAIPVLFVFIGTVAALSFAKDTTSSEADALDARSGVSPVITAQPPAVLFKPLGRPIGEEAAAIEELIAGIEAHLRREREAAQGFTRSPSAQTLWVN